MNASQAYQATTPYISAYFRQQHPALMQWNLLLNGYIVPDDIRDLPHLELGFGQGLGLMLSAASNHLMHFVGVDFMQAHVDAVASVQSRFALNIDLYANDFLGFLSIYSGQVQSVSLHGVWSWVDPEVRMQLISIFDRLLAPGGIVYMSHNTLPGRAPLLPIQRLLHLTGKTFKQQEAPEVLHASFEAVGQALNYSRYAEQTPTLSSWWQEVQQENPIYLEHEYMNDAWYPMLFADTDRLLSKAGLSFACSADAIESIEDLHLTDEQLAVLSNISLSSLRESYRDLLRNTGFRRDIWIKQGVSLSDEERLRHILSTPVTLIQPIGALPFTLQGDLGVFELNEAVYSAVVEAIAASPRYVLTGERLLDLLAKTYNIQLSNNACVSILQHLTAMGYLHPAQSAESVQSSLEKCFLLNRHLCFQSLEGQLIEYLASPLAGCAIQVSRWQQLCLVARALSKSESELAWYQSLYQNEQGYKILATLDSDLAIAKDKFLKLALQFKLQRYPLLVSHHVVWPLDL